MADVLKFPASPASQITVHEVAPSAPPVPPPDDAIVVITRDANGRILSYGWVVAEMGRENVIARAFNLRDVIGPRLAAEA